MGNQVPKPSNKSMVDRLVERSCFIHTPEVEGVFRAVDRAMYFEIEEGDSTDPYEDDPWKRGNLHLSAPCIYARVVGALKLESGLSFLNMGSGTGYLNTLIGLLIGPNGVNHGIELHGDVVEYAYKKLEQFKSKSRALDKYDFSEPIFVKGNCLNLNPNLRYDRIYLGAACLLDMENSIKKLVKPNGGILVMPFGNRLVRHTRINETEWKTESLMEVNFTQMIGQDEDKTMIDMPKSSAKSLKELCRIVIRRHLREKTDILYPNLLNSDNIDHRRARQMKASKLMLRAKKPAGSSESNNNICSMSSSSSMSRDKTTCRCPSARNQLIGDIAGQDRRLTSRLSNRDRSIIAMSRRTTSSSAIVGQGGKSQTNIVTKPSATTSHGSKSTSNDTGRVMTRSASRLLLATDATNSGINNAGNSNSNNIQATQSSSGSNRGYGRTVDNDAIRIMPSQSSNSSSSRRLLFRPNEHNNSNRDQYRKHIISSSDSTSGDSSDIDENNEDDDNPINNTIGDSNSRLTNHCARTRPYRVRSGHQSDAFSGIILGSYSRGSSSRRRQTRQLRWATLSEPDESDSIDSDDMSPLREPWCVARQLKTHQARLLHLRRVTNSDDNPMGRINIEGTPSTSESSLTSLADLILGNECISSGDDSWDNSTSATSELDSFDNNDDDDDNNDDNDEDDNFCLNPIPSIGLDVRNEVYHDDADDIDGILDDSILANSIESQSSSSSSSPSSHSSSYLTPSGSSVGASGCNINDKLPQPRQGTSGGVRAERLADRLSSKHKLTNTKSSCADEPVARRLRSRGLELPNKLLVINDDAQSSENPESSTSGRSDHEATTGQNCLGSTSARARPILPLPSTSIAGSQLHFRFPKHMASSGKKLSQTCANNRIGSNCVRMNHSNHRHCRRHCKEAQCQTSSNPMQSTSSSSLPLQSDLGRAQNSRSHAKTPSASLSSVNVRDLNANTSGSMLEDVDLTSSNESLSYNNDPVSNNDNFSVEAAQQTVRERKRKRRSSSESSEISNETTPCWLTSSSCQHPVSSRSKRDPRRRVSGRRSRCSCSQISRTTDSISGQNGEKAFIVMSDAANRAAIPELGTADDHATLRPPLLTDEGRNEELNATNGRASLRTRFLLHNTWSDMLHREVPTLDVLTRLSLRATDPLSRSQPSQSGSTASCLASLWPQMSSSSRTNQVQRRRSVQAQNANRTSNDCATRITVSEIGLMSSSSSSDVGNQMSGGLRPASSAIEPSGGGNSSIQQTPRQRVNCCCCRYCRNVRRSRRERKQKLHHQSKRVEEFDTRHRSSYRRRGRRRRESESEKYYTHMSGYIRQLPIPRVLHEYLNFDRGF